MYLQLGLVGLKSQPKAVNQLIDDLKFIRETLGLIFHNNYLFYYRLAH